MASKRPIRNLLTSAKSNSSLRSASCSRRPLAPSSSACAFSTSNSRPSPIYDTEAAARPRWQQTPARMVAPVRTRPRPAQAEFEVNSDPMKLDEVYKKILGPNGEQVLSEEVKWLAVTHKSFDHGRRGFNDRLAYMGRRIISLQTSLSLLSSPNPPSIPPQDRYGRAPFTHPALAGLSNLSWEVKDDVLNKSRLANLAERYGLNAVIRWKPKKVNNLQGSGIEAVLSTTLYAIVGAVALERGGEAAKKLVKEKILQPLGL